MYFLFDHGRIFFFPFDESYIESNNHASIKKTMSVDRVFSFQLPQTNPLPPPKRRKTNGDPNKAIHEQLHQQKELMTLSAADFGQPRESLEQLIRSKLTRNYTRAKFVRDINQITKKPKELLNKELDNPKSLLRSLWDSLRKSDAVLRPTKIATDIQVHNRVNNPNVVKPQKVQDGRQFQMVRINGADVLLPIPSNASSKTFGFHGREPLQNESVAVHEYDKDQFLQQRSLANSWNANAVRYEQENNRLQMQNGGVAPSTLENVFDPCYPMLPYLNRDSGNIALFTNGGMAVSIFLSSTSANYRDKGSRGIEFYTTSPVATQYATRVIGYPREDIHLMPNDLKLGHIGNVILARDRPHTLICELFNANIIETQEMIQTIKENTEKECQVLILSNVPIKIENVQHAQPSQQQRENQRQAAFEFVPTTPNQGNNNALNISAFEGNDDVDLFDNGIPRQELGESDGQQMARMQAEEIARAQAEQQNDGAQQIEQGEQEEQQRQEEQREPGEQRENQIEENERDEQEEGGEDEQEEGHEVQVNEQGQLNEPGPNAQEQNADNSLKKFPRLLFLTENGNEIDILLDEATRREVDTKINQYTHDKKVKYLKLLLVSVMKSLITGYKRAAIALCKKYNYVAEILHVPDKFVYNIDLKDLSDIKEKLELLADVDQVYVDLKGSRNKSKYDIQNRLNSMINNMSEFEAGHRLSTSGIQPTGNGLGDQVDTGEQRKVHFSQIFSNGSRFTYYCEIS